MVRWDGPLSHVARHIEGCELRGLRRWFDTNFYDRQVAVVGPIRRPAAFCVHDYEVANEVAQKPVKTVLPGVGTFVCHSVTGGQLDYFIRLWEGRP